MKIAHREKVFGPGRAVPLYRNGVQAYARAWSHQHHQPGQHKGPITRAFLDVLQGLSRSGTVRLAALGGSSPSSGAGADLLGVGSAVGHLLGPDLLSMGSTIGGCRGFYPVGIGRAAGSYCGFDLLGIDRAVGCVAGLDLLAVGSAIGGCLGLAVVAAGCVGQNGPLLGCAKAAPVGRGHAFPLPSFEGLIFGAKLRMLRLSRSESSPASAGKLWPALVAGFGFSGCWVQRISLRNAVLVTAAGDCDEAARADASCVS